MYQNTRGLYDVLTTTNRNAITQKPAQYTLDVVNEHRLYRSAGAENIDVDTNLRMQPTRLNYFNRPETELYGTAPYQTRDTRAFVDVESNLRNGYENVNMFNKGLSEKTYRIEGEINEPLAVDSELRPMSTRAKLRNDYCSASSKAHSTSTHTVRN